MTMGEEARLTEDEREDIDRAIHAGPQWGVHLVATIERIIAERVAQAKAEALRGAARDGLHSFVDEAEAAWLNARADRIDSRSEEADPCPVCGEPREIPGEGRFCGSCRDYEGTCTNDHCMTCGSST